jgi:hypothetical protein
MWDVRTDGGGRGDLGEDRLPQMVRRCIRIVNLLIRSHIVFRGNHLRFSTAKLHSSTENVLVVKIISSLTLRTASAIDLHRTDPLFATASNGVHVWDETKYASRRTIFCFATQI